MPLPSPVAWDEPAVAEEPSSLPEECEEPEEWLPSSVPVPLPDPLSPLLSPLTRQPAAVIARPGRSAVVAALRTPVALTAPITRMTAALGRPAPARHVAGGSERARRLAVASALIRGDEDERRRARCRSPPAARARTPRPRGSIVTPALRWCAGWDVRIACPTAPPASSVAATRPPPW